MAKAQAAEQKAANARDATAYEQAWREAARLWDRAAERESDDKRRQQYTLNAEQAREQADAPRAAPEPEPAPETELDEVTPTPTTKAATTKRLLN